VAFYNYKESEDFPNNKTSIESLYNDIVVASTGIADKFLRIDFAGGPPSREFNVHFNSELTPSEQTELSGIISSHDHLYDSNIQKVLFSSVDGYANIGTATAAEIQFTQIYAKKNQKINYVDVFINNVKTSGNCRIGVYDTLSVNDGNAKPKNKMEESSNIPITSLDNETFKRMQLNSEITFNDEGYYYLAFITDNSKIEFASTLTYRKNSIPVFWDQSTGTTLPSQATPKSENSSVLCVIGILEDY
jgi:hypothetical protein